MLLIVTLGYPKRDHLKQHTWNKYNKCGLQVINWETGATVKEITYRSPGDRTAPNGSIQFGAGSLYQHNFYVPSRTEVLVYNLPGLYVQKIYSHPTFNDLHHVTVKDDLIYICNTGLEIIQIMTLQGDLLAEYNAGISDTWKRFRRDMDYRLVPTTKPHETHTNFIFFLEEELWCTRFIQRDAVCLTAPKPNINLRIGRGGPHDGLVQGDFIYFTLTEGYIVIVNKNTFKVEEIVDLNQISNYKVLLGWCRGIEVIGSKAYVGFSALRSSSFREYGLWIKHGKKPLCSRIAEYDLNNKTLINELPVAQDTGAAIYTIKCLSLI
ncbi:hypothetical protein [Desulfotruncus alcoholivorax]|uniref:hypothetical protein n=1 Tax=Desulfotruncus alcoholivorax TaxID=265477 RepID=UPI0003F7CBD1|nr:hypothetical protein [Desulfotruncus alcoholivorax]